MITPNKLKSIKARIRRAQTSLSCMGDMLLEMEIDGMTYVDKIDLRAGLMGGRISVTYKYLEDAIKKGTQVEVTS